MSGARLAIELRATLARLLLGLLGWICIAPIAWLWPRRLGLLAVVGRDGQFGGNAKYFHLQCLAMRLSGVEPVFLTTCASTAAQLTALGLPVRGSRFWSRTICLLRAGSIVVDSTDFPWRFLRFFFVGARVVQLWHGVGYKRIGLDKWRDEVATKTRQVVRPGWGARLGRLIQGVNGRLICYDVLVSTSVFYTEEVFRRAMLARHWLTIGYPRNSFGAFAGADPEAVRVNADRHLLGQARAWRDDGRRVVLFAPTFRDSGRAHLQPDAATVAMLDRRCAEASIELVFKLHPRERGLRIDGASHLHVHAPQGDVYPLLPLVDAFVTDYSSLYMDYLLLDRPVLFLVPDLEQYLRDDRSFQFPFADMTPGPKVADWPQLFDALATQWRHDEWAAERARLRRLAFDDLPQDQAVPKLLAFMREQRWLP